MRIFDTSIGKVLRCLIHHLARCVQLASVISLLLAAESLADDTPVKKASSNESIEETIETRDEIAYDPTTRSLFPGFYYKLSGQIIEWEPIRRCANTHNSNSCSLVTRTSCKDMSRGSLVTSLA